MNAKAKKWTITTLILIIVFLISVIGFVAVIDPFFHYHKPLKSISYNLFDERYQNYGVVKHFDYDAIIVGTSMTENFKASQLNELFGVTTVKVPFAGGTFKETNDLLKVAFDNNSNIKMVVRSVDYDMLFDDKDKVGYLLSDYPSYLYDDNLLNDTKYVFNKSVILNALQDLIGYDENGKLTINFDTYGSWGDAYPLGPFYVNQGYARNSLTPPQEQSPLTEAETERLLANLNQNFIELIEANPDTDFYLFFTPYSIYYYDFYRMLGNLDKLLQLEKITMEKLTSYSNVHLFSFSSQHDMIWDLENYRDMEHYGSHISEQILIWLRDGVGELNHDNYLDYWEESYEYFTTLDYDAMYKELSE